jgi:hypothetical protein
MVHVQPVDDICIYLLPLVCAESCIASLEVRLLTHGCIYKSIVGCAAPTANGGMPVSSS